MLISCTPLTSSAHRNPFSCVARPEVLADNDGPRLVALLDSRLDEDLWRSDSGRDLRAGGREDLLSTLVMVLMGCVLELRSSQMHMICL